MGNCRIIERGEPIKFPPIRVRVENVTDANARTQHPQKHAKISSATAELDLWLRDLVRQELATLPSESVPLWNAIAAPTVDAHSGNRQGVTIDRQPFLKGYTL